MKQEVKTGANRGCIDIKQGWRSAKNKNKPLVGLFLVDWGRFRAGNWIWFISLFLEVISTTEVAIFEVAIPLRLSVRFVGATVCVQ